MLFWIRSQVEFWAGLDCILTTWLESCRICQTFTKKREIGEQGWKQSLEKIKLCQVYIQMKWESSVNCLFLLLVYCLSLPLLCNSQEGRNHYSALLTPRRVPGTKQVREQPSLWCIGIRAGIRERGYKIWKLKRAMSPRWTGKPSED